MDALVSLSETLYGAIGDVHIAGMIAGAFKTLAYLAFLYLLYRWYRETYEGGSCVLSPQ